MGGRQFARLEGHTIAKKGSLCSNKPGQKRGILRKRPYQKNRKEKWPMEVVWEHGRGDTPVPEP